MRRASVLAVALALPAAVTARAGEIRLDYRVYLGGLHVLSLASALEDEREGAYRMTVLAHTDGLIATFVDASYEAETAGDADGLLARPAKYRGTSRDGDEISKKVSVTFNGDGAPEVVFDPADAAPDEPLPAAALAATVDPVSAMLTLMRTLAETGRCEAEVRVFDGKRRYDLSAKDAGTYVLKASRHAPYGGPATKCRVRIARIAGFREGRLAKRYPDELTIFLAPVFPGEPPVPVRVHGDNLFGALRMHLVNLDGAAPQEQAQAQGGISPE
jgi:hypothetical protein